MGSAPRSPTRSTTPRACGSATTRSPWTSTSTACPPPSEGGARPGAARGALARHAASLLVLRHGADRSAPTVLMGLRGARHRFMANRLVFPGGAVDRADFNAPVAATLPATAQLLAGRAAKPRLAHALAVAAARELEEETALTLGAPPDLSGLDYLCRAVTPPGYPIRFNARFFVVDASAVAGTVAGSGELEDLRWYGLDEALAIDLATPTRFVIESLRAWLALTPAGRAGRREAPLMQRRRRAAE